MNKENQTPVSVEMTEGTLLERVNGFLNWLERRGIYQDTQVEKLHRDIKEYLSK